MRWWVDLRDLALVSLLWLVLFVIADNALWVPQRIFIIWITGGVLAGLLLVVQPRRWWLVIVPYAIAVAVSLAIVPLPWSVMLVGAVGESAAAVVYAVVLRRHASADTGLGAPVGWVLAGTVAGVLVRMSAVTLAAVVDPGLTCPSIGRCRRRWCCASGMARRPPRRWCLATTWIAGPPPKRVMRPSGSPGALHAWCVGSKRFC